MADQPTYTERAFAPAQGGKHQSLKSIREQLKAEAYSDAGQLNGSTIRRQLTHMIATSKLGNT